MAIDSIILPGLIYNEVLSAAFHIRPNMPTEEALCLELTKLLGETTFKYRISTETSPGELKPIRIGLLLDTATVIAMVKEQCPQYLPPSRR